MAATANFYQVLGVSETATADEIKKAYRRLAKKYHPDVTGGDKAKEAKFKEITQAYEVIGDDKKRVEYDTERRNPFASGRGGGPFRGGPFPGGAPFPGGGTGARGVQVDLDELFGRSGGGTQVGGGFSDLFSELFGGGQKAGRGADINAEVEIDLNTAAFGGEQALTLDGRRRVNVRIPPGVEEGQVIKVAGKGQPGRGNLPAGDLLLTVHFRPHPHFRRQGLDLEVDVPITIAGAVLGGKVEVQTLEGKAQLSIPAGTSSGVKLRLRGKGLARRDGTRGDLFAVTQIQVPKDLSERARELIREFAELAKG